MTAPTPRPTIRPPCPVCHVTRAKISCRGRCGKILLATCLCRLPPRAQQYCDECQPRRVEVKR